MQVHLNYTIIDECNKLFIKIDIQNTKYIIVICRYRYVIKEKVTILF